MAEKTKSGRSTDRPLPNVALEHRLNHLSYGTLGRISYNPADDDTQQIGRMQTNRDVGSKSTYSSLHPLIEICPPTRTIVSTTDLEEPTKVVRAQKNWLLKSHPEAVVVGSNVASILSEEIAELKTNSADGGHFLAPLAVGEITDHTDPSQIIARPALAMAAGEGGHILHIVTLDRDVVGWSEKELSVHAIKVSQIQSGEWVEDGAPITNIRFAVDGRRYDPIRWIIVQKATGTTVFEPEIMLLPYQGNVSEREHIRSLATAPSHISAKRLFTIKTSHSGGSQHVDVAFNPVVDGRFPQLAIVDKSGRWSVWDITGSRSARPKVLQPMLTARGSIETASVPGSLGSNPSNVTHKVLWLALEDQQSLGLGFGIDDPDEDYHWGLYARSPIRAKHVLVCSDTDVRLYDSSTGTQLTGIKLVNRVETVLDVQSCPFSPSQIFVLTTAAIFWLDVKLSTTGDAKITVILSCAHYRRRNADNKSVRFNAAPLPSARPSNQCAIFISADQDTETDMFIFTNSSDDDAARVAYQAISLDLSSSIKSTLIAALPLFHFKDGANGKRVDSDKGQRFVANGARVFQLFGLGTDLSLWSSLFTVSDASIKSLGPPELLEEKKSTDENLRKKFLKHLGDSFVVPDGYEEGRSIPPSSRERARSVPERQPGDGPADKVAATVNLEAAYMRLKDLMLSDVTPKQVDEEGLVALLHRRMAEEVGDADYMRLRSLSELVGSKPGVIRVDTLEDDMADLRESLFRFRDGRAQLTEVGEDKSQGDLESIANTLSMISFATEDMPDEYRHRCQHHLRQMAAEQYLSCFGISSPPPQAAGHLPFLDSQSQSQFQSGPGSSQLTDYLPSSVPSSPPVPASSRPQSMEPTSLDDHSLPDPGPLARLRQYITIPDSVLDAPKPAPTRLLSHWQPGADPWSYVWRGEDSRAALQEEAEARRRQRDEARRKRMEKRMRGLHLVEEPAMSPSVPIPRIIQSSQIRGGIQSSQARGDDDYPHSQATQSQRLLPRISMSQVVPGPFGARPGAAKKKKGKSGFR